MSEEDRAQTKQTVLKQLKARREEHMAHLLRALFKSHPDLATFDLQDKHIQQIDRALVYIGEMKTDKPPEG
jgi:septal ring factor EnvC (AmiA/AmiB activator)